MGIPFSREINRAFEELDKVYGQITPLIAAAYEVLETTKNISLLVAGIQVLTVILLALILLVLTGLLITMNPDLETERKELVTPALKWLTLTTSVVKLSSVLVAGFVVSGGLVVVMVSRGMGPFKERWDKREGLEEEGEGKLDGSEEGVDGDKDGGEQK